MTSFKYCGAFRCCIATVVLALMCGCGDDGMVDIAGEVSIDGKPIGQGTIGFFPTDNRGATAEAVITDGRYAVTMPKGDKKVVIRGYEKVGERFPWGKDNPPADVLKEIVPKEFNDESDLRLNAEEDNTKSNFDLSSK